jgi:regulatory protein
MGTDQDSGLEACRERALGLVARRPHTVRQLRGKLLSRKFPKDDVEAVLADFLRLGLLDDRQLAFDYCEAMKGASPPVGRSRVIAKLRHYGVDSEILEEAIADVWDGEGEDGELDRAMRAAEGKLRLVRDQSDPRKLRGKLYRFLAGKGFSGTVAGQAIDRLLG